MWPHAYNDDPSWSPDGQRILYVHYGQTIQEIAAGTDRQVWLYDCRTGENRFLVPGLSPTWMPDDSSFIYNSQVGIARYDLTTGGTQVIFTCGGPSWARPSPDGRTITCNSNCQNEHDVDQIWMLDLLTGYSHNVVRQATGSSRFAAWSPDGSRLAHVGYPLPDGGFHLFVMDTSGANVRQLRFDPELEDHDPTWSHDGNWIYFGRAGSTSQEGVWRIHPDGTGAQLVVPGGASPSCSPLDTAIVFDYLDPVTNSNDVWMSRADGSGLHRVAVYDTATTPSGSGWRASARVSSLTATRRRLYR